MALQLNHISNTLHLPPLQLTIPPSVVHRAQEHSVSNPTFFSVCSEESVKLSGDCCVLRAEAGCREMIKNFKIGAQVNLG